MGRKTSLEDYPTAIENLLYEGTDKGIHYSGFGSLPRKIVEQAINKDIDARFTESNSKDVFKRGSWLDLAIRDKTDDILDQYESSVKEAAHKTLVELNPQRQPEYSIFL